MYWRTQNLVSQLMAMVKKKLQSKLVHFRKGMCCLLRVLLFLYITSIMILDAIHKYHSLPLILSYPKSMVFLSSKPHQCVLLLSGIDLYFMFVSESIHLEKIHVNVCMINTNCHE